MKRNPHIYNPWWKKQLYCRCSERGGMWREVSHPSEFYPLHGEWRKQGAEMPGEELNQISFSFFVFLPQESLCVRSLFVRWSLAKKEEEEKKVLPYLLLLHPVVSPSPRVLRIPLSRQAHLAEVYVHRNEWKEEEYQPIPHNPSLSLSLSLHFSLPYTYTAPRIMRDEKISQQLAFPSRENSCLLSSIHSFIQPLQYSDEEQTKELSTRSLLLFLKERRVRWEWRCLSSKHLSLFALGASGMNFFKRQPLEEHSRYQSMRWYTEKQGPV